MPRFNLNLSDDLDREIEQVMRESGQTKSDIVRKSLLLYLKAREGEKRGFKLGLVDKETDTLKAEIFGL